MTATSHLDPPAVTVDPGGEQQVTVHVRNDGDIVEAYRLEVVGPTADWAVLEPATLSLYPGSAETAVLTFRPPRSHLPAVGELPYAVRVLPSERPEGAAVPEGTVTVLPWHGLDGQLLPRTTAGRLRARSQVQLANRGNLPASVRPTATDPADRLRLAFKPAAMTLAPGESGYLALTVRSRKRLWRGKAKSHPFQVLVTTDAAGDAGPTVLTGGYEQQPLLPGWVFVLAAAGLGLVALWFTLVRPSVQSAARQSVDTQVKAAVASAVNSQAAQASQASQAAAAPQSGGGGSSPKPGTHPGGGSSPAAPTSPAAGGGATDAPGGAPTAPGPAAQGQFSTHLDTSVSPGKQNSATYQVPDDSLLLITDFVADAPQGDEGTLTVTINGKQVTSLALESFRDSPGHFVTPLQAPPKSKIVLSVTCRKPGTPPDEPAPTSCAESLFVSGSSVPAPSPTPSSSAH
ncbi:hypothetical protein P3T37_007167 [Kitasatospora sp. MAA4]|uniref:COG1470 family protein n=1 Tax=Kitasatospora sp. MAA4 TaxID=3035093 RepID=UPI002475CF6B|nr:hydrolytic protein [Kitasatospora sp. MAA4]MDH6137734.1 hypothetical protein [Kitasatospora sp. MAA4]